MIAEPVMLINPAKEAGIAVPDDCTNYDPSQFSRFHLFCCAQLGQPMPYAGAHWDNVKVIAALPEEEITTITFKQLFAKGFLTGYS